jgi:hypothetical protein
MKVISARKPASHRGFLGIEKFRYFPLALTIGLKSIAHHSVKPLQELRARGLGYGDLLHRQTVRKIPNPKH